MDDKRLRRLASEAGLKDTIEDVAYIAYLKDLDRFANLLLSMERGSVCRIIDTEQIPKTEAERIKKMIKERQV